jgi:hypothetical protein
VVDALLATRGTPEGLYGRRKMTAHLRRVGRQRQEPALEQVSPHTVDRLMRDLGLFGVRRGKKLRTTIPDPAAPARSPDLLERDFTAAAPNQRWVADFTYVRTWAGFVFVAFLVDVYAQRIVGWHAATTRTTELVLTCLRMATWQREHDGHPVQPGQLTQHHDAGSQYTSLLYTEHLAMEASPTPSAASATPTTTHSWKASSGSTRPSAYAPDRSCKGRSRPSRTSSSRPWRGSTGGTTVGSTAASATSRPPRRKPSTTVSTQRPDPRR